ncbi:MAG: DUF7340 domain-containing protein, partial [Pseudonocardiaceae bacterium]
LRASGWRHSTDLGGQLRSWARLASAWATGTPPMLRHSGTARDPRKYLEAAVPLAESWVTRTHQILAPETATFEAIGRPCPHCGERTVFVWSPDHGEKVQRAALYFDKTRTTVRCRAENCGAEWLPQMFEFLGRLLAVPETV